MRAAGDAEARARRFDVLVNLGEGAALGPAHEGRGGEVGQDRFLARLPERAHAQVAVHHHRRAGEVLAHEHDEAIAQYAAEDGLRTGEGVEVESAFGRAFGFCGWHIVRESSRQKAVGRRDLSAFCLLPTAFWKEVSRSE